MNIPKVWLILQPCRISGAHASKEAFKAATLSQLIHYTIAISR